MPKNEGFIDIELSDFTWLHDALETVLTPYPNGMFSLPIQVPFRANWTKIFTSEVCAEVEAALEAGTVVYYEHKFRYGEGSTGVLARPGDRKVCR